MIYEEQELVALVPGNLKDNALYSHQGLTYGGIILKDSLKLFDVAQIFQTVLKYLEDNGIEQLVIKEIPSIYCKVPSDELEYLMFLTQGNCFRKDTLSVIDNSHFVSISTDRNNGYKRGVKHGLEVREVNDLKDFWESILIPNLKERHKVSPVHSLEEITLLKQKFPKKIRQFNVYHNNEIVAGTTIFEAKLVAHSQYISGNSEKNTLGSLDFLHMHLIKEVFQNKPYFDFGISNENQGRNVNKGLQYWKEGFGARTIVQRFYKVETRNHKLIKGVFI